MTLGYQKSSWATRYEKLRTGPYEVYVSQTNLAFYPAGNTKLRNAPIFYAAPHNAIHSSHALDYNNCFIPTFYRPQAHSARAVNIRAEVDVIKEWIQICEENHDSCNISREQSVLSGLAVMDCFKHTVVQLPDNMPNVTLSYVWGTQSEATSVETSKLPEHLPPLVEDAMVFPRQLGYQYLWIDRYCVPQDDDAVKETLIINMDTVYSESVLTIIASGSHSPEHALIGVGSHRSRVPESVAVGDLKITQLMTDAKSHVLYSKWNSRGWTYQEGLLAQRRVIFTNSQCYFQCAAMCRVESISVPEDKGLDLPNLSSVFPRQDVSGVGDFGNRQGAQGFRDWAEEYAHRNLTHEDDSSDAFKGILNRFCSLESDFYGHISGIPLLQRYNEPDSWKMSFLYGLTWIVYLPGTNSDHKVHARKLYSSQELLNVPVHRAQLSSWAWCGWNFSSSRYSFFWELEAWYLLVLDGVGSFAPDAISTTSEMIAQTDISVGFKDIEVASLRGLTVSEVADMMSLARQPQCLQMGAWVSELHVPSVRTDDIIVCGPYEFEEHQAEDIRNLATIRGFSKINHEFIFKIWVTIPVPSKGRGKKFATCS
ncbi:heterokaryon incompatibility protein-domain-containing protein [Xylariales sp. PMI_506]|nr:heterokaryon incompatibility protein-domain-containing protein [Xylariales sp. PMI_506]